MRSIRLTLIIMLLTFAFNTPSHALSESAGSLSLKECINIALENNSVITIADYSVDGARAQMDAAYTQFLPKLIGKASYLRYDSVPTFDIPGFGTIPFGTRDNLNYSFEVTQPIFTGGRIKSYHDVTKSAYDSAKQDSHVKKKDVVRDVTNKYFQVLKANKLVEITRSSRDLIRSHLDNVNAYFEAGILSKNDQLSAEVSLANAENFLIRANNGYELAKSSLNYSLNRDVNTPVLLEDIDENEGVTQNVDLNSSFDRALTGREELVIADNAKKIGEALIMIEKSALWPQIYFIGAYTRTGDEIPLDEENFSALFTLELDIFDWGETGHNIDNARIGLKVARENETIIKNSIRLEVKAAFLRLKQAHEEINATKQAIRQAEENMRIYKEKCEVKAATSTDVLDANNLILRSRINYYQALYDFHIAKVDLKRAVGNIDY